ncbi:unnamed protein product [Arabidopsis thaliana]|uniref:Uncharacterized protein n=1 Tax=Arabidopsis thaliana TaxID=3702 RepID=A0A5S9Y7P4_ARATH|nr:unnamed protein product [Arabidopsis thaliana]
MAPFIALFTGLCGFKKNARPLGTIEAMNQSSPRETKEREQTNNDLQITKSDTNAFNDDNSEEEFELPLPPGRKGTIRGTYSCNNMVLRRSMSTKKKLSASLTIQMPRSLSMVLKRDKEEDKSVRKKKPNAENSVLVRPIILGERCRVLDAEEGDEDQSQRMPNNRIYRPRSMSSSRFREPTRTSI